MIVVSPSLIVLLLVLMVILVSLLAIFFKKPQTGKKVIEKIRLHAPYEFWLKAEGAEGVLLLLIFLSFLVVSCMLCLQLVGLIQNMP